jgi:hypothetical protein
MRNLSDDDCLNTNTIHHQLQLKASGSRADMAREQSVTGRVRRSFLFKAKKSEKKPFFFSL